MVILKAGAQWKSIFCPPTINYLSLGGGQKTLFHWVPALWLNMMVNSIVVVFSLPT